MTDCIASGTRHECADASGCPPCSGDDHPGIVQHSHYLAHDHALADRIDAGRPEGFEPPPQRRWRLVLDLGGDDVADLRLALDEIDRRLEARERQHPDRTGCSLGGTSGSSSSGYHWELIERPEADHETYFDELMAWRDRRRP